MSTAVHTEEAHKSRRTSAAWTAVAVVAALVVFSVPALGSPTASGQWDHTHPPVTCTFSGIHSASGGLAYARTNDVNNGCTSLQVRLKYQRNSDGAVITENWWVAYGDPAFLERYAPVPSVAMSSGHRAFNGFGGTWSAARYPHSF